MVANEEQAAKAEYNSAILAPNRGQKVGKAWLLPHPPWDLHCLHMVQAGLWYRQVYDTGHGLWV